SRSATSPSREGWNRFIPSRRSMTLADELPSRGYFQLQRDRLRHGDCPDDRAILRANPIGTTTMRLSIVAVVLVCTALVPPAAAQNAVTQEGTVLQNSPMMFRGNNRARQGAGVGGAPTGQIVTTGDSVVGGRCDYSAATDDPNGYYK